MLMAFVLCVLCIVVMVLTTFLFPEPFKAEAKSLVWENWSEPLRNGAGGSGLGDYRVLSAVILGVFIALYFIFR